MLRTSALFDLRSAPNGPPLSLTEAAVILETSTAKVAQRVRDGALEGRIEDGRVIGVARSSVRRALELR
jgi:hypothetical protein